MIPNDSPSSEQRPYSTPDELNAASITVIAAWRNGYRFKDHDVQLLWPSQLPDLLAGAMWAAICHYEAYPDERSEKRIMAYAREQVKASDADWEAFWERVDGALAGADQAAMSRYAKLLRDHDLRVTRERDLETCKRAEEDRLEGLRIKAQEQKKPPAFTAADVERIVYHGHTPPRAGLEPDALPGLPPGSAPGTGRLPSRNVGDGSRADVPSARLLGRPGAGQGLEPVLIFPRGEPGVGRVRFELKSAADVLTTPLLPVRWLLEKTLRFGGQSIIFGRPGTKKTYIMLWLAVCVALGIPFLGLKTEQTNVLFVDEESGEERLRHRLHEVLLGAGGNAKTPIWYIPRCGFKFMEMDDLNALCSRILQTESGLVVVDSFAATASGDENSKKEMQPVMERVDYVQDRTGAHLSMIHHTPKNNLTGNGTPRGSGVLEASPDFLAEIKSAKGSRLVDIITEKNRDAEAHNLSALLTWYEHPTDINQNTFTMERVDGKREEDESSYTGARAFVLDYLDGKAEVPLHDLIDCAEGRFSESAMRKAARALEESGDIRRVNPKGAPKGNGVYLERSSSEED